MIGPPASPQEPPPRRRWAAARRVVATLFLVAALVLGWAAGAFGTRLLIVGVDRRPGDRGRADVLLLVSPRPLSGGLVLLSIPRDTRVELPRRGAHKVNAAYAFGGAELARQAVEELTGVRIHRAVVLDFEAVRAVVDALGCVTVDVDRRMRYRDPYQDLEIDLEPGRRCLDGEQALGFVRFRNDPQGDITRTQRHRAFVRALIRTALRPASWPRLPAAWRALAAHVEGEGSELFLARFALASALALAAGSEEQVLPGRPASIGGASYWIPDPEAVAETTRRLFGP